MSYTARRGLMLACALVACASVLYAQTPSEERFTAALEAFEAEAYDRAYAEFVALYRQEPVHDHTAAALLMAGKALYRRGRYQESMDLLEQFRVALPRSRYLAEAEQVIAYARLRLRHGEVRAGALRLGVALPLSVTDPSTTQALFNGIHVAVELHNQRSARPVQIIFRDTHGSRNGAYDAVRALIGQHVDAIIGPLYSGDVKRVAPVVDEAGVAMVAPLANAANVTGNWRHVFQVNPTFAERGRFMARQAIRRFGYTRLGIVSEPKVGRSEAMARGFEEEVLAQGAEVAFHLRLDSERDWARIPELMSPDTLTSVEAVYLPLHQASTNQEIRVIESVLTRLGRVQGAPHILGTESWGDVSVGSFANRLKISYADVSHVRRMRPDVRAFQRQYRVLGVSGLPDRLAYVGYDVASFLIGLMDVGEPLVDAIGRGTPYEGLGTRIQFDSQRQNTAMFLLHLDGRGSRLAR